MPVARRRLALDGAWRDVTLAYLDWGDPASERVVLCVHGLTRNAHDFDDLAAHLAAAGARVLAVDVAGRGRSSWLADPNAYVVPTYAAHLARFCQLLRLPPVDWVGTSMGGLIGMALAASDAPPLRRLVLNDIGPFVPHDALVGIKAYLDLDLRFASLDDLEAHLRVIHAPFGDLDDAQWRRLARTSARRDRDGWRLRYDPAIRAAYAEMSEGDVDLWELWDRIAVPTFVLRGQTSPILPAGVAAAMAERGPRAEVVTVEGVGHAPALLAADQIATVRRWLDLA